MVSRHQEVIITKEFHVKLVVHFCFNMLIEVQFQFGLKIFKWFFFTTINVATLCDLTSLKKSSMTKYNMNNCIGFGTLKGQINKWTRLVVAKLLAHVIAKS